MLQAIYIWKLEGGGGNNVGQYVAKYKNNTLCLTFYRKNRTNSGGHNLFNILLENVCEDK